MRLRRTLMLLLPLLLLSPALTETAEAQRRGGFGGFRSSRPSFPSRPSFSAPRPVTPPPRISTPPPSLPAAGGFGGGAATGIAGAPKAPSVPPSMPSTGGFGGGDVKGVMGATAKKPISSKPDSVAPPDPSGSPGRTISSAPPPRPAPTATGNVYEKYRRVEPVRGSRNVYVYDHRPWYGFMPFWWYPPIYTPGGMMVSHGGPNPLAILLSLVVVGGIIAVVVSAVNARRE